MKKIYEGISFKLCFFDLKSVIMVSGGLPGEFGHDEFDDYVFSPWEFD